MVIMDRTLGRTLLYLLLAGAVILLVDSLSGCANLEREQYPDATDPVEPPVVVYPDAWRPEEPPVTTYPDATPPAMVDAAVTPPTPDAPEVCDNSCDDNSDCDPGHRCKHGQCFKQCGCDDDCSPGYDCIYGLCKKD